jgi:hypothetical protein
VLKKLKTSELDTGFGLVIESVRYLPLLTAGNYSNFVSLYNHQISTTLSKPFQSAVS